MSTQDPVFMLHIIIFALGRVYRDADKILDRSAWRDNRIGLRGLDIRAV
jgi:hypothetical protein